MQRARIILRQWRSFSKSATQLNTQVEANVSPALSVPQPEGSNKPVSPKIEQLVTSISQLNLLEVAELSEVLKKRLNLPDAPVMTMATGLVAPAAAEDDEDEGPKTVKTNFTLKLLKFDENQKVALIKEVKNLLEGMNLVQAKKFIESSPVVVKADVSKDEAEKLKEALTKVGATCEIV